MEFTVDKGHGKSWKSNMLLRVKRQKDKKWKKITDESETGLISVQIDTSIHFIHNYNVGKYVK